MELINSFKWTEDPWKILVNGDYQIHIDLPKGYRAVENDFFYTVGERINRYLTSFVEVSDDQVEDQYPTSPLFHLLNRQRRRKKVKKENNRMSPIRIQ